MQKSLDVRGHTVDEAIRKGLAELGLAREQVEIELLSSSAGPDSDVLVRLVPREDLDAEPVMRFPLPPTARLATPSQPVEASSTAPIPLPSESSNEISPESSSASEIAKGVLERLLRGMGIRSQVVVRTDLAGDDGPDFVLDIVGADLGILIGRRGETLRDLEYITRLITGQQVRHNVRFAVDVEGYRARRERVLRELARRMADRVRQSRQPITLEAMPPHERRIVHITLREHPNVKTQSIGEGDHRRVMILPK